MVYGPDSKKAPGEILVDGEFSGLPVEDARLIAAAPDMLAALDLAVTEADHAHDCEYEMAMRHHYARLKWIRPNATRQYAKKSAELDATRPDVPCTCWIAKCVEAIAKAKGGAQ